MRKRKARDYKFIRLLGEGSFSSVYLALDIDAVTNAPASTNATDKQQDIKPVELRIHSQDVPGAAATTTSGALVAKKRVRKYAIKVCQKSHIKRQGKQVAIMREKEIMNILNESPCEHFIHLYCTFQDMERLFFVMSYAENGELLTYMLKHPLSVNAVQKFTLQLVTAIEHLHKLKIIHRDLKPENILLDEYLNLMISDFGSAKICTDRMDLAPAASTTTTTTDAKQLTINPATTTTTASTTRTDNLTTATQPSNTATVSAAITTTGDRRNSFVGTAQYVSPEMLKEREASNKSDLWALGIIIYQMMTNIMPFDAPNEYLIYKKIQSLDYKFPEDFNADARDLVNKLIRLTPNERLGANDDLNVGYKSIRGHCFLANISDAKIDLNGAREQLSKDQSTFDPDLQNIDKISPGLDETQMLRLLTDT